MQSSSSPSDAGPGTGVVRQTETAGPAAHNGPPSSEKRETRVEELRKQYESGRYLVDAEELSAKIVEGHLKRA